AALRREVEPVPAEVLGRFLPSWHGVGIQASGLDRLTEIVFQLQGCAIPASVLERDVLPVRVREYRPQLLDQLISMGEVVWTGRNPRRALMRLGPPAATGRWSLVRDLLNPQLSSTEHIHAMAGVLLQRYGVLTREAALAESISGGFAALYPVLRAMEEAGKIRRGYFIDGLGGLQFALPGAVDRLRGSRDEESKVVALAATDPASPYGTTIPWPEHESRMARAAGAYVVLDGGELRLYLERGGRSLLTVG